MSFHCFAVFVGILFCCTNAEDVLDFVMIGDWGGQPDAPYYTKAEADIATQMGKKASDVGARFTVALGDNFYDTGVKNVDDPRFKETFEDVFTDDSLQSRWYVVAGNHDHYGNASAEIAYTARSNRWYMPNYYYTETITTADTEVQFVFIDTVILAGLTHPKMRWFPPSGPASLNAAEDQWEWIESTLAASTARWLFVLGHYPVWSIAEHGPTDILVHRLRPLLMKYNVTAYFCGHDHNAQHIHENGSSVEYFVTGAAHRTNPSEAHKDSIPPNSLLFHYGLLDPYDSDGAFNWVSISSTTMNTTFVDDKGKDLYFYSKKPTRML